ncbi:glycosyltransferase [Haloglycomyces albus]|uniref:glycosyltransferase n=1 Tax=Haloglycomyces albus TaxID=526067 RepID=UPI00046D4F03|nr:glycosyltransferase [Haloglycomyces albus]
MRVVLSAYGSRGDIEPMVGLGVELKALGVEVVVCAPPDFEERLARDGLESVPVIQSVRELVSSRPQKPGQSYIQQVATGLIADQYNAIMEAADGGCDAVLGTGLFPASAAARAAAEKLGAYYTLVGFYSKVIPSPHHAPMAYPGHPLPEGVTDNRALWEHNREAMNSLFGGVVNDFRTSIGMAEVDDVRGHVFTDRPWIASDPVLDPWKNAAGYEAFQTGAWIPSDERALPDELEAFLNDGEPPVYVGFGSMAMREAEDVAQVAIESVRTQGRRILLSSGWAGLDLNEARDDCFGVGEVNQQALFGRVAAVVHHGGAGTTTTCARAGAPQVIVPQIADQPYWAERVADLGIGAAHDGPVPTVESLSAGLEKALAPGVAQQAESVVEKVRTDGASVAAKRLVDLTDR